MILGVARALPLILTLVLAWIGVLRFTPFPPTMPLLILASLLLPAAWRLVQS